MVAAMFICGVRDHKMRRLSLPGCLPGGADSTVREVATHLHSHISAHVGELIPISCALFSEKTLLELLENEKRETSQRSIDALAAVGQPSGGIAGIDYERTPLPELSTILDAVCKAFEETARSQREAADCILRLERAVNCASRYKRVRNELKNRVNRFVPELDAIIHQLNGYLRFLPCEPSLLYSALVLMGRFSIAMGCPYTAITWRPLFFTCLVVVHKQNYDNPVSMKRYANASVFYSPKLLVRAEALLVSAVNFKVDVLPAEYAKKYLWCRIAYKYITTPSHASHGVCREFPAHSDVANLRKFISDAPAVVCSVTRACDDTDLFLRVPSRRIPYGLSDYRDTPKAAVSGRETPDPWNVALKYDVVRPLPHRV